jgi:hypothetical protein
LVTEAFLFSRKIGENRFTRPGRRRDGDEGRRKERARKEQVKEEEVKEEEKVRRKRKKGGRGGKEEGEERRKGRKGGRGGKEEDEKNDKLKQLPDDVFLPTVTVTAHMKKLNII